MGITIFVSLYTTRIVLNALGIEDFGIFNLIGGAIAMLTFLNASMASASQRFMSYAQGQQDKDRQRRIFNASIIMHAIIAITLLLVLEGIGILLFKGVIKIAPERMQAAWIVYQLSIISTIFIILSVPYEAVINARENMLLIAILGIAESFLKLGVAHYLLYTENDKLIVYVLFTAIVTISMVGLKVAYCHQKYNECIWAPKKYADRRLFKEMATFASWSFMGTSSSMVSNYGQGIVLNTFFGTKVNAAQGIASQISGQLGAFASTMLRALNPLIAKSEGAGDRQLMLRASMIGSKMGFLLILITTAPVLLEMPYIFDVWLKIVPEYTVIFCQLLLVRNLIEQLFIPLASSIAAVGKIRNYQISTSILTLLPLPAAFILFKLSFEPYALYATFVIYSIITSIVILYYAYIVCNIPVKFYLKNVIVRCLAALTITLSIGSIPLFLMPADFSRLIIVTITTTIAFFFSAWHIGFDQIEKKALSVVAKDVSKTLLVLRKKIFNI